MTEQLESLFSRNLETICELGLLSLSGADGMMRCQFGHTRQFLALGGDQLRQAYCRPLSAEAWQTSRSTRAQDAAEMAGRYIAALAGWQAESMRLIEQQASAANGLLKQAMNESLNELAAESAQHRAPPARSRKGEHKLAA
jgi:hypothetical protein